MPPTPSTDRRAELLDRIIETLAAHGVADLSLRPLAEQVGTSARLLIYHFDSKEQLVADALNEVRRRIAAALAQRADRARPQTLRDLMMMIWDWAGEPASQPYLRLLFEVDGLAMYDRISFSAQARRDNSQVWIALIDKAARRLPGEGELFRAHATLIMGAFNGLMQEFLSTGDRAATTAAMEALANLIGERRLADAPTGPRP